MQLNGRTALVTGGADGLGWAMVQRFSRAGARVVIADLREDAAAERAAEIRDGGGSATAVGVDVTDELAVTRMFDIAASAEGVPQILVNNAGVTRDAVLRKMSLDDFRLVIDVHLQGAWLCTRAAVSAMRGAGLEGAIVNMSSISGKVGNPGQSNYSAAKAGMVGLTKSVAKEVARYGVRVNAIAPGLIRTIMTERMHQDALARGIADVPLGRIGEPEDVAEVALFLASESSSYLTGCVLEVSGGRNM